MNPGSPLPLAMPLAFAMLAGALLLVFARLVRGPTTPDRVVALDLAAALTIGMVALHALDSGEAYLLQVATVVALVSFLGTVAFARYVSRRGLP